MPDGDSAVRTPPIEPGSAHVWIGSVPIGAAPLHGSRWLSPVEHSRAASYRFPADRSRYMLARAMLRGLLGEYLDADPASFEFEAGEFGKPHVSEARAAGLEFNSSRSNDLVLCAFCIGQPVGVDIELVRTDLDLDSMAATVFGPSDIAALSRASEPDRAEVFFEYWTRKEAAAKLSGAGLNADMKTVDGTGVSLVRLDVPDGYVGHLAAATPFAEITTQRWDPRR